MLKVLDNEGEVVVGLSDLSADFENENGMGVYNLMKEVMTESQLDILGDVPYLGWTDDGDSQVDKVLTSENWFKELVEYSDSVLKEIEEDGNESW